MEGTKNNKGDLEEDPAKIRTWEDYLWGLPRNQPLLVLDQP